MKTTTTKNEGRAKIHAAAARKADSAYQDARSRLDTALAELKGHIAKLDRYQSESDKDRANWGYAGTAKHIANTIEEINATM
jgi:hypothetical protein